MLDITDFDGKPLKTAHSLHNHEFVYTKGRIVKPDGFDENRWNVCGKGIHFYITKEEAIATVEHAHFTAILAPEAQRG